MTEVNEWSHKQTIQSEGWKRHRCKYCRTK